ncbi:glycosyl hydrolase family 18 protein [Brevibacillus fluminis]|uniref:glycosyl hydrolase family 18 protein n=1 Tax=Brevibacillus fluminis TaxID=511487 RepID=UPI003F8B7EA5
MAKEKPRGKRTVVILGITVILGMLGAWGIKQWNDPDKLQKAEAAEPSHLELSAWVADWQWQEGIEDLRSITDGLSSVQMFAAYFNEKDSLLFTAEAQQMLPKIKEAARQSSLVDVDLTIVNDRVNPDGTEVQKDSSIVTRLMATEESREKHLKEILDAVERFNFHGVELDYEKVDEKDWPNLIRFIGDLNQQLHDREKTLRVVLEPRTPIEKLSLPQGPVYVMMAYNLNGPNTQPGPKADQAFIAQLANRLKQVPGDNIIALSAGGFDWAENGEVTAVTEKQAVELSRGSLEPPRRDAASGSLSFQYVDKEDGKHTVWYADDETVEQWIQVARQSGYTKIALWRLGGLDKELLRYLNR